jgi:hypothetical protein
LSFFIKILNTFSRVHFIFPLKKPSCTVRDIPRYLSNKPAVPSGFSWNTPSVIFKKEVTLERDSLRYQKRLSTFRAILITAIVGLAGTMPAHGMWGMCFAINMALQVESITSETTRALFRDRVRPLVQKELDAQASPPEETTDQLVARAAALYSRLYQQAMETEYAYQLYDHSWSMIPSIAREEADRFRQEETARHEAIRLQKEEAQRQAELKLFQQQEEARMLREKNLKTFTSFYACALKNHRPSPLPTLFVHCAPHEQGYDVTVNRANGIVFSGIIPFQSPLSCSLDNGQKLTFFAQAQGLEIKGQTSALSPSFQSSVPVIFQKFRSQGTFCLESTCDVTFQRPLYANSVICHARDITARSIYGRHINLLADKKLSVAGVRGRSFVIQSPEVSAAYLVASKKMLLKTESWPKGVNLRAPVLDLRMSEAMIDSKSYVSAKNLTLVADQLTITPPIKPFSSLRATVKKGGEQLVTLMKDHSFSFLDLKSSEDIQVDTPLKGDRIKLRSKGKITVTQDINAENSLALRAPEMISTKGLRGHHIFLASKKKITLAGDVTAKDKLYLRAKENVHSTAMISADCFRIGKYKVDAEYPDIYFTEGAIKARLVEFNGKDVVLGGLVHDPSQHVVATITGNAYRGGSHNLGGHLGGVSATSLGKILYPYDGVHLLTVPQVISNGFSIVSKSLHVTSYGESKVYGSLRTEHCNLTLHKDMVCEAGTVEVEKDLNVTPTSKGKICLRRHTTPINASYVTFPPHTVSGFHTFLVSSAPANLSVYGKITLDSSDKAKSIEGAIVLKEAAPLVIIDNQGSFLYFHEKDPKVSIVSKDIRTFLPQALWTPQRKAEVCNNTGSWGAYNPYVGGYNDIAASSYERHVASVFLNRTNNFIEAKDCFAASTSSDRPLVMMTSALQGAVQAPAMLVIPSSQGVALGSTSVSGSSKAPSHVYFKDSEPQDVLRHIRQACQKYLNRGYLEENHPLTKSYLSRLLLNASKGMTPSLSYETQGGNQVSMLTFFPEALFAQGIHTRQFMCLSAPTALQQMSHIKNFLKPLGEGERQKSLIHSKKSTISDQENSQEGGIKKVDGRKSDQETPKIFQEVSLGGKCTRTNATDFQTVDTLMISERDKNDSENSLGGGQIQEGLSYKKEVTDLSLCANHLSESITDSGGMPPGTPQYQRESFCSKAPDPRSVFKEGSSSEMGKGNQNDSNYGDSLSPRSELAEISSQNLKDREQGNLEGKREPDQQGHEEESDNIEKAFITFLKQLSKERQISTEKTQGVITLSGNIQAEKIGILSDVPVSVHATMVGKDILLAAPFLEVSSTRKTNVAQGGFYQSIDQKASIKASGQLALCAEGALVISGAETYSSQGTLFQAEKIVDQPLALGSQRSEQYQKGKTSWSEMVSDQTLHGSHHHSDSSVVWQAKEKALLQAVTAQAPQVWIHGGADVSLATGTQSHKTYAQEVGKKRSQEHSESSVASVPCQFLTEHLTVTSKGSILSQGTRCPGSVVMAAPSARLELGRHSRHSEYNSQKKSTFKIKRTVGSNTEEGYDPQGLTGPVTVYAHQAVMQVSPSCAPLQLVTQASQSLRGAEPHIKKLCDSESFSISDLRGPLKSNDEDDFDDGALSQEDLASWTVRKRNSAPPKFSHINNHESSGVPLAQQNSVSRGDSHQTLKGYESVTLTLKNSEPSPFNRDMRQDNQMLQSDHESFDLTLTQNRSEIPTFNEGIKQEQNIHEPSSLTVKSSEVLALSGDTHQTRQSVEQNQTAMLFIGTERTSPYPLSFVQAEEGLLDGHRSLQYLCEEGDDESEIIIGDAMACLGSDSRDLGAFISHLMGSIWAEGHSQRYAAQEGVDYRLLAESPLRDQEEFSGTESDLLSTTASKGLSGEDASVSSHSQLNVESLLSQEDKHFLSQLPLVTEMSEEKVYPVQQSSHHTVRRLSPRFKQLLSVGLGILGSCGLGWCLSPSLLSAFVPEMAMPLSSALSAAGTTTLVQGGLTVLDTGKVRLDDPLAIASSAVGGGLGSFLGSVVQKGVAGTHFAVEKGASVFTGTAASLAAESALGREISVSGALTSGAVSTAGAMAARTIGANHSELGYVPHKLMHGVLGGAMGSLLAVINGSPVSEGALSGAMGGTVGEIVGEKLVSSLRQRASLEMAGQEEIRDLSQLRAQDSRVIIPLSQLVAALTSFTAGYDPSLASLTATNAVEHNALSPKPVAKALGKGFPGLGQIIGLADLYENRKDIIGTLEKDGVNQAFIHAATIYWGNKKIYDQRNAIRKIYKDKGFLSAAWYVGKLYFGSKESLPREPSMVIPHRLSLCGSFKRPSPLGIKGYTPPQGQILALEGPQQGRKLLSAPPTGTKPLALPPSGDSSLPNKGKLPKPEKSVTIRNGCSLFKGKTPAQVEQMFIDKGFTFLYRDPKTGSAAYRNPKTHRKYYIDNAGGGDGRMHKKGPENPHVDIYHFKVDAKGEPVMRNGIKLDDKYKSIKIPMGDTEDVNPGRIKK